MMRRNKFIMSGGAIAANAAIAVSALAVATPSSSDIALERTIVGHPTTAVTSVSPEIEQTLSVFRTNAPTPVPAELVPSFASPTRFGRNPELARLIHTVTGPGYVIPGDGYVCIAVPDPIDGYGSTCSPVENIKKRGLYIGLKEGAIPAGKHAQTVVVPDGASVSVPGESGDAANRSGVVSELVDIGDNITVSRP